MQKLHSRIPIPYWVLRTRWNSLP